MYKEFKRIVINNKVRILYKLPKSNKLYIKSNKTFVLFSDYKKKIKGGIAELEILNNRDENDEILDPINLSPIPENKQILIKNYIYNIDTIYQWVSALGNNFDPFTRLPYSDDEKNKIWEKYISVYKPNRPELIQDRTTANKLLRLLVDLYNASVDFEKTNTHDLRETVSSNYQNRLLVIQQQIMKFIKDHEWLQSSDVIYQILINQPTHIRIYLSNFANQIDYIF
jgi:hypothetical protein